MSTRLLRKAQGMLIAFTICVLISFSNGMKASKLIKFPQDRDYVYLTKFSVGEQHNGQFNFRAGFSAPLEGDERGRSFTFFYSVVTDDNWMEFLATDNGSRKLGLSYINSYVQFNGDGYWSTVNTHSFYNEHRTTVFFIVAMNGNMEYHVNQPWLPKIWMELKAFNGGEHFPQEDWGLLTLNILMFVIFIFFLGYSTYGYIKEIRHDESWESPLAVLVIALIFEFFQIISSLIHLSVYEFDGEGIPTLEVVSTIGQVGSQVFIVTLLMLIAFGWTITYTTLPEKDTIIIFAVMTFIIHALIAGLTALDKNEYHKYHDYSGIQGFILVLLRFILFGVFLYGLNLSKSDIKRTQEGFLRVFTVAGTSYILAFPILYLISYLGEPYVRNRVIVFGHFIFQTFSGVLLLFQLSAKTSKYKDAKIKYIIGK